MKTASIRPALRMLAALAILASGQAYAGHIELFSITPTSTSPGATTAYTVEFRIGGGNGNVTTPDITVTFPAGYNVAAATFSAAQSGVRDASSGPYNAFPAHTFSVDPATRVLRLDDVNTTATSGVTMFRLVFNSVGNPSASGTYPISVRVLRPDGSTNTSGTANLVFTVPPGVDLDVPADAATYASEIIASTSAPVTLTNAGGVLNLNMPLRYSFSPGEVRYARLECPNLRFASNSAVTYSGGGSASVGAINGLGTRAISFSVTANSGVTATDRLVVSGDRDLLAAQNVDCTYSLYDQPSEAAQGGPGGRIATLTGPYLQFAPSTVFTASERSSTANVEATPSYTAFIADGTTTTTTAALARLTYGLASPAPMKINGSAITLSDLHATGASGTRIVVSGDFSGAADTNGSYSSGTALARVYLSTSNSGCTFGTPASSLSATTATFNVGATATDRMLCYVPRSGVPIQDLAFNATLDGVSVAPSTYAVGDIGPRDAGRVVRNGTQLQAPMINMPQGYVSRVALTNTSSIARRYTLEVLPYEGAPPTVDAARVTGMIPANGGTLVELRDLITGFGGSGATRAVIVVTVEGANTQIQGQYQIVNPASGGISNYVMVRPGQN